MKTLTFKYTKADGKQSNRTIVVSNEPTKLYAGTDISSLSMEDQALYIAEVGALKEAYLEALKEVNSSFDLNFNYRQFKPECMSTIVEEDI